MGVEGRVIDEVRRDCEGTHLKGLGATIAMDRLWDCLAAEGKRHFAQDLGSVPHPNGPLVGQVREQTVMVLVRMRDNESVYGRIEL